jgi:hypothetical protein
MKYISLIALDLCHTLMSFGYGFPQFYSSRGYISLGPKFWNIQDGILACG